MARLHPRPGQSVRANHMRPVHGHRPLFAQRAKVQVILKELSRDLPSAGEVFQRVVGQASRGLGGEITHERGEQFRRRLKEVSTGGMSYGSTELFLLRRVVGTSDRRKKSSQPPDVGVQVIVAPARFS